MVRNQSVKSSKNNNLLTISTEIWDFHFEYIPTLGYYTYDSITVSDTKKDLELSEIKDRLLNEIFFRYGITDCL